MKSFTLLLSSFFIATCATSVPAIPVIAAEHPEARPFDPEPSQSAKDSVESALVEAKNIGRHALIVMGANWCHDSRALAGWFEKPRFVELLQTNYVVRYIDVGQKDKNIDIAQEFGLADIVGTPTVIVTDSQGAVLNLDTAPTWRNAASRSESSIFEYFEKFAPQ